MIDLVSFDNDNEYILTNRPRNSYDPAWIEIIQADRMISSFIESKNKKKRYVSMAILNAFIQDTMVCKYDLFFINKCLL